MWVRSSGSLSENLFQVNTAVSSHFVFVGECAALVDTSVTSLGAQLGKSVLEVMSNDVRLKYICLTHVHFDHIGGLPELRRMFPEVEVVLSSKSIELLGNAETLESAYERNVKIGEDTGQELSLSREEWMSSFENVSVLGDGDSLDLGAGLDLKCLAAPGHTLDSTAYYSCPDCALVAGEAVGAYWGRDKLYPAFMDDYSSYLESLDRLAMLEVRFLGFSHSGALSGDLPAKYLVDLRLRAEYFKENLKARLAEGKLRDEIFDEMLADWRQNNISPDGPFKVSQEECLRSMIDSAMAS